MVLDAWKFSVERHPWSNSISIRVGIKTAEGRFDVAKPAVLEAKELGSFIEPMLMLPFDAAQSLMDEMWSAGVRPSQTVGTAGQLESVKYHLEDMRRLVFEEKAE